MSSLSYRCTTTGWCFLLLILSTVVVYVAEGQSGTYCGFVSSSSEMVTASFTSSGGFTIVVGFDNATGCQMTGSYSTSYYGTITFSQSSSTCNSQYNVPSTGTYSSSSGYVIFNVPLNSYSQTSSATLYSSYCSSYQLYGTFAGYTYIGSSSYYLQVTFTYISATITVTTASGYSYTCSPTARYIVNDDDTIFLANVNSYTYPCNNIALLPWDYDSPHIRVNDYKISNTGYTPSPYSPYSPVSSSGSNAGSIAGTMVALIVFGSIGFAVAWRLGWLRRMGIPCFRARASDSTYGNGTYSTPLNPSYPSPPPPPPPPPQPVIYTAAAEPTTVYTPASCAPAPAQVYTPAPPAPNVYTSPNQHPSAGVYQPAPYQPSPTYAPQGYGQPAAGYPVAGPPGYPPGPAAGYPGAATTPLGYPPPPGAAAAPQPMLDPYGNPYK